MDFPSNESMHRAAHDLTMEYLRNVRFPVLEQQGVSPHTTPHNYASHYAQIYKEMVIALNQV